MSRRDLGGELRRLRDEFDASFVRPIPEQPALERAILAVDVDDLRLALRVEQIGRVLRCPAIRPVPSSAPALVGLASVRARLVAVFDLASAATAAPAAPRAWLAIARTAPEVGFAFDAMRGQVRVPAAGAADVLTLEGTSRRLLDLDELVASLQPVEHELGDKGL